MIDSLLKARVDDAVRLSRKAPHFIGFLDPAEKLDVSEYLSRCPQEFLFFGGFPDADRCFVGFFPDYLEPSEDYFPIEAISVKFDKRFELSHRDFLGSLMAQGITRSSVGDILIEEGRAVFFVKEELSDYFIDNIFKIGKVGVTLAKGIEGDLPSAHSFEDVTQVIASARLDCIVAGLCGLSRDKAASAVNSGLVQLNYRECTSGSHEVKNSSVISVRGKGKFLIDSLDVKTKKGRLVLKARKYK